MKAPFSWPNNSLSMVPSGMAPQFTAINWPCFRFEKWCTTRGMISLPTPLSPKTKTDKSVGATCEATVTARSRAWLVPMTPNRLLMEIASMPWNLNDRFRRGYFSSQCHRSAIIHMHIDIGPSLRVFFGEHHNGVMRCSTKVLLVTFLGHPFH